MSRTAIGATLGVALLASVPAAAQDKPTVAVVGTGNLGAVLGPALGVSELFGFGRPDDKHNLPAFPRRDPPVSCDEWRRRADHGEQKR